jgi:hypothetical protein
MTKTWTWSRNGWVLQTPDQHTDAVVADEWVPYRTVTLPPRAPTQRDESEDEEEFTRLMKVRREALGLSLDEVAFFPWGEDVPFRATTAAVRP